ncbi:MAG: NHL repeat-containing protein [Planctomycetota bacterium]|nr:NHL repeat-containing protein [Planctomycetota bacterium]
MSRHSWNRSGWRSFLAVAVLTAVGSASCEGSSRTKPPPPPPPPGPQSDLVLGHTTSAESAVDSRGLDPLGLSGLHFDGTTLYVSDAANHRVLILDGLPSMDFEAADRVLGQDDFNLREPNAGGISAASLNRPGGSFSDGQRLYVCDSANNRVLVWDSPPASNRVPADHVIGQADFSTDLPHRGGLPAADTLENPLDVFADSRFLYVSDVGSHRILIWNLPLSFATEGPPADHVLGQVDFSSVQRNQGGGTGDDTLASPRQVYSNGSTLFVTDKFNNRVLIWNIPPTWIDGQQADGVLGQPDFTSGLPNLDNGSVPLCSPEMVSFGRSRRTFNLPFGITGDSGHLYVADELNHRIMIWNTSVPADYACADVVLGQPDGTSGIPDNGGRSAATLRGPQSILADGNRLLIYDERSRRVKIHQSIPASDNAPADVVFGQPDFVSGFPNHRLTAADVLHLPSGIAASPTRLAIADSGNRRVLIWDPLPSRNGQPADIVLGQPDFMSLLPSTNPDGMARPVDVAFTAGDASLLVADSLNHRILVFDSPFGNAMAATAAVGQPFLTTNQVGTAQNRLSEPAGIILDGSFLWVADRDNHRVLRFTSPFSTNQSADLVLGQPDFVSGGQNGGGSDDRSLSSPTDICAAGTALIVTDRDNHRVMIWEPLPQTDNEPAVTVLGQPDFLLPGLAGSGATGLDTPIGVAYDGQSLFITDSLNHRVLRWDAVPPPGGMSIPADEVFGQLDFDDSFPNSGGVSSSSLDLGTLDPAGAAATPDGLFLADPGNSRVLRVPGL